MREKLNFLSTKIIKVRNRKENSVVNGSRKYSFLAPKTLKYMDFLKELCCKMAEHDEFSKIWVYNVLSPTIDNGS